MGFSDCFIAGEVGDSASDTENFIVGAGRKIKLFGGRIEEDFGRVAEPSFDGDFFAGERGVGRLLSGLLDFASFCNVFSVGFRYSVVIFTCF